MPTKSEVVYQRALHFKQLVSEVGIKHYEQGRFAEIVDEIFNDVFNAEITKDEWTEGKDSFVNGEDNVRGES